MVPEVVIPIHAVFPFGNRKRVQRSIILAGLQMHLGLLARRAESGWPTALAAVCTTRSRMIGMPSGRSPPPGFGIITLLASVIPFPSSELLPKAQTWRRLEVRMAA
jgi:hypothetical protein